jgi:hypothetical protein
MKVTPRTNHTQREQNKTSRSGPVTNPLTLAANLKSYKYPQLRNHFRQNAAFSAAC